MHISCLRALSGNLRSLELERDDPYDIGKIDQIVTYNCVLTRAATLGVQHLNMSLAPPGHWALSMFLWGSLQTLRVNFVGVHQLEEFADSFSELSRLKELQLRVSRIDWQAWDGKRHTEWDEDYERRVHDRDPDNCLQRASTCYAERIIPALQDVEQLSLGPLLQPDLELLLQHIPKYRNLRNLGIWPKDSFSSSHIYPLKLPISLSPNLGRLRVLRWPEVDKLEGLASAFYSLEELFVGESKTFEPEILKDFKCLKHVHVWNQEWSDQLSIWLRSNCPHVTCHKITPVSWTDM